jgi:hypothetical protein
MMRVSQTRRSTAAAVEPTELTLPLAPPAAELYLLYFGWDPAVPSARASAPCTPTTRLPPGARRRRRSDARGRAVDGRLSL